MSFLLDALRKSERDRRIGEVPRLMPDLPADTPSEPPKRFRFEFLIAFLVLVNIGTLLYLAESDREMPKRVTGVKEPPEPSTASQGAPAVGQTGSQKKSSAATRRINEEVHSNRKPAPSGGPPHTLKLADLAGVGQTRRNQPFADLRPIPKSVGDTARSAVPEPIPARVPVRQSTEPPKSPGASQSMKPVDKDPLVVLSKPIEVRELGSSIANPDQSKDLVSKIIEPVEKTEPPAPFEPIAPGSLPTNDQPESIPLLAGLPREFQRKVPSLKINVFAYSENPEDRFVIINMSKYRAGQKIDDGPEIVEIRPDSLVLEYLGTKFRFSRP